jgi:GNAT superfamily N-acetyltransferase
MARIGPIEVRGTTREMERIQENVLMRMSSHSSPADATAPDPTTDATSPKRVSTSGATRPAVTVRRRQDADAGVLVEALAELHLTDSYPMKARHANREWLYDPAFEASWVAEAEGSVVGHIAVIRGFSGPGVEEASGRAAGETLGITRFFVRPGGRGSGAASALLNVVDDYAAERRAALGLEVVEVNAAAVALYERRGWRLVGSEIAQWFGAEGPHPTVFFYVAPEAWSREA